MKPPAAYWIHELQLEKHIEGGSFREVYRSGFVLSKNNLPPGFAGDRNISTSIYFLLEKNQFSAFHRIASDELWHFYYGDGLVIYEIEEGCGKLTEHKLGSDPRNGESFQTVIRAGNWFASRITADGEYALAGCTVAPGFDFADFTLAERTTLIQQYPQHAGLIRELTL